VLKLKKLQIAGFKSFCDRTELVFSGTGVVGVVGPNGCGKSNIADAVGWVLGEQSAKSLRGTRMEDVIFSGSRDRPAAGLSEVSLTMVDPDVYNGPSDIEEPAIEISDEWEETLPAADGIEVSGTSAEGESEASSPEAKADGVVLSIRKRRRFTANNRPGEVVVTRRLYRSGESEYLLNGRLCRLRDIQEIFLGTGLGPESYAIIEQGRVGQILTSKPYERRAIIEEAAGVTKYKAKRKLAEARLESARGNLNRINDIFEEVTKQLGQLRRQASKAARFREIKTELDQQQRRLLFGKAVALDGEQERTHASLAAAVAAVTAQQQRVSGEEADRTQWFQQATALEQRLQQLAETAGRLAMEQDRAERQIFYNGEQATVLERRIASLEQEQQRIAALQIQLQAELAEAAQAQQDVATAVDAARAQFERDRSTSHAEGGALAQLEGRAEIARRRMLTSLSQLSTLGNEVAQGETLLAGLERQQARLEQERTAAMSELDQLGVRRGQLGIEFQGQQNAMQALLEQLQGLEQQLAAQRAEESTSRQELERSRGELADVAARRRSLEEIVAHHGYSTEAVKALFANGVTPAGFHAKGVLADFLEVEPAYEAVVEEFLREELNYVVVDNWDDANAGLGVLRQDAGGRATFLVHPEDGQFKMFDLPAGELENSLPPDSPIPVPLRNCVRVLNGFGRTLEHILPKLGSGYITPDTEQARGLANHNPQAYFLTAKGECFHNQTVTGGTHSGSGPLTMKRELRELARREAALTEAMDGLQNRIALLGGRIARTQAESDTLRQQRFELEKQSLSSDQSLRQLDGEVTRVQARLQLHTLELERARQEQLQAAERLNAVREQRLKADADRAAADAEETEANSQMAGMRERRAQAAQRAAETQAELARLEERARAAESTARRLDGNCREAAEHRAQTAQDLAQTHDQRVTLQAATTDLQNRLAEVREEHTTAEQEKQDVGAELTASRLRVSELETSLKVAREALEERRREQVEIEITRARLESEAQHLAENCRNELGCELAALFGDATLPALGVPPAEELPTLEDAVRTLRDKIERLGPVNMMALEECKEAETRHAFLDTQRTDLLNSIADTQKGIQEIDVISREQFNQAFEKINTFFQETFQTLFGGGQGFLRLTDIENNPDAGVEIVAQPPGKKLQNALLLSGGEKAMTATALLMAVFRYQPSPFCIMDEVDAPLDESNVSRFTAMVEKMSSNTQFIVITHNKRTMEIAPVLYGVTMQQAGVSRMVSVRMEEPRRAG